MTTTPAPASTQPTRTTRTPLSLFVLGQQLRPALASAASSAPATCRQPPIPPWSSGPVGRRRRWATSCSSWATTTSATRSSSSPT